MKTIIIIPAYNAEKSIGSIVNQCLTLNNKVVVVDNNSIDSTILTAKQHNAIVMLERNQGQGAATRRGWQEAIRANYDTVVTLDADGQHNPKEIPVLLAPIIEDRADIIVGSRFISKHPKYKSTAPIYRKFGINIINYIYNVGHKKKLIDTQSCFRAYNKKAFTTLKIEENGFGFSTELLIKARKLKLRVIEVPVSCIYHNGLENNSTLNPVKHGVIVAWKTLYWRLKLQN